MVVRKCKTENFSTIWEVHENFNMFFVKYSLCFNLYALIHKCHNTINTFLKGTEYHKKYTSLDIQFLN